MIFLKILIVIAFSFLMYLQDSKLFLVCQVRNKGVDMSTFIKI